jgi:dinuclear metal center YbgI/SA1388 family protein
MIPGPEEMYGALDSRFPFDSAYDWDNSGWQILTDRPVSRCLVALDPTPEVVAVAIESEAQLILTHHPLYFPNLTSINPASPQGLITRVLLEHQIGLISAHSNADRHLDGVSGALAEELGLINHAILMPDEEAGYFKLVTFVPDQHMEEVRSALALAGAGVIGNYTECSFSLAGVGTYRPQKGAKPVLGEVGKLEEADEHRLEMRVPAHSVREVIQALRVSHPYDEIAYDLFQTHHQGGYLGAGVLGEWKKALAVPEALAKVKQVLGDVPLQVSGPEEGMVQAVAVASGSTNDLLPVAAARGAHLFVGGDLKYHNLLDYSRVMVCVDGGHRATELAGVRRLADVLRGAASRGGWETEIVVVEESPALGRVV